MRSNGEKRNCVIVVYSRALYSNLDRNLTLTLKPNLASQTTKKKRGSNKMSPLSKNVLTLESVDISGKLRIFGKRICPFFLKCQRGPLLSKCPGFRSSFCILRTSDPTFKQVVTRTQVRERTRQKMRNTVKKNKESLFLTVTHSPTARREQPTKLCVHTHTKVTKNHPHTSRHQDKTNMYITSSSSVSPL